MFERIEVKKEPLKIHSIKDVKPSKKRWLVTVHWVSLMGQGSKLIRLKSFRWRWAAVLYSLPYGARGQVMVTGFLSATVHDKAQFSWKILGVK